MIQFVKYYHRLNYSYSYRPGLVKTIKYVCGFKRILKSPMAILQREHHFPKTTNILICLQAFGKVRLKLELALPRNLES